MARPKTIDLDDDMVAVKPSAVVERLDDADDINARIAAEVADKIKSRAFSKTSTFGKATLFDVSKQAKGLDYTVGGLFVERWCLDDEINIRTKRTQGYMFPEEVSPALTNLRAKNLILMIRTKEAAQHNRDQVKELAQNLEGKDFENSALVEQGNSLNRKAGKVFRNFEKIEAGT